jgi:hypothetical protein
MSSRDDLIAGGDGYCLCKPNAIYVVYLKNGGPARLDLSEAKGAFEVQWYDPRNGGPLLTGTAAAVPGGGARSLGRPPKDADKDWAILIRRADPNRNCPPAIDTGVEREEDLNKSTAPAPQALIGKKDCQVGDGQTVEIDVTPLVTGNGTFTVVLTLGQGGNDIWFGSKRSRQPPRLVVVAEDPSER